MRRIIARLLHILDGTAAEYAPSPSVVPLPQKGERGQSVVEMALITPILIILFAGLVEIGWFANNYLTLLDVTRAGARRGTSLTGEFDPVTSWDRDASYVPPEAVDPRFEMPYANAGNPNEVNARLFYRDVRNWFGSAAGNNTCDPLSGRPRAFYNELACTMVRSMEPLTLHPENGIDDIVISGFSVDNVDDRSTTGYRVYAQHPLTLAGEPAGPKMVVVGRYPTNANECDVSYNGSASALAPQEPRDPFDWNGNGSRTNAEDYDRGAPASLRPAVAGGTNTNASTFPYLEIDGYDATGGTPEAAEKQVGFVWFGNHQLTGTSCIGSEWTIAEVETLFNLPGYSQNVPIANQVQQRDAAPGQGMVLVEMYWQHTLLLQIPVLSPVFDILGDRTTISVWAAFPVPSFEPTTFYYCDPDYRTSEGLSACSAHP